MGLFNYRDTISSELMNRAFVPIDNSVERLLSIADTISNHNKNIEFVTTHIANHIHHIEEFISSTGMSLADVGCLLPMFLPTKSYNIELLGGTFTLQRDWKSAIDLISHGPFTIKPFDVTIDSVELNGVEKEIFGALFSGDSVWFVKETNMNESNVKINFSSQYPVTEIMIVGLPSYTYTINLIDPEPSYTYGNLFIVNPLTSGTIEFTIPSVNHNGKKYCVLKHIGLRYSIPAAYGEIVTDFNYTDGETLTRMFKIADGDDSQIRIVISDKDDYIVLRDEDVYLDETIIYDSSIDPMPLAGGYYELSGTLYLHMILLNSADTTPHVKKLQWQLT